MLRLISCVLAILALLASLDGIAEAGSRSSRCRSKSRCYQRVETAVASSTVKSLDRSSETFRCENGSCRSHSVTVTRSTAQSRVDRLAVLDPGSGLHAGHHAQLGPVSGFEGLGYGSSPEEAIRHCCFYGQRPLRESATAQGPRGWYAVNLYD